MPLLIASNQRFELTKAATIIAVVNITYYVSVYSIYSLITSVVQMFTTKGPDMQYERVFIVVLFTLSLIPSYSLVKAEFKQFDCKK